MKYINILFFTVLTSMSIQADSLEKTATSLGLFSKTEKSYTVGEGKEAFVIKRSMTSCAKNKGYFQPFSPVKGVKTITESELLHALNDKESLLVDMRIEEQFLEETIPTAINIPFTEVELRLDELGCVKDEDNWDCSKAVKVYAFCNGPVCAQSPIAIKDMVRLGFPAEKIFYYRGGMLVWDALGLNTVAGEF